MRAALQRQDFPESRPRVQRPVITRHCRPTARYGACAEGAALYPEGAATLSRPEPMNGRSGLSHSSRVSRFVIAVPTLFTPPNQPPIGFSSGTAWLFMLATVPAENDPSDFG